MIAFARHFDKLMYVQSAVEKRYHPAIQVCKARWCFPRDFSAADCTKTCTNTKTVQFRTDRLNVVKVEQVPFVACPNTPVIYYYYFVIQK